MNKILTVIIALFSFNAYASDEYNVNSRDGNLSYKCGNSALQSSLLTIDLLGCTEFKINTEMGTPSDREDFPIDYKKLNIKGLGDVHKDGWTGKGSTVLVIDHAGSHGKEVNATVRQVAPDAKTYFDNILIDNENNWTGVGETQYDVFTHCKTVRVGNTKAYNIECDKTIDAIAFNVSSQGTIGTTMRFANKATEGGIAVVASGNVTKDGCGANGFFYCQKAIGGPTKSTMDSEVFPYIIVGGLTGDNKIARGTVKAGVDAMHRFIAVDQDGVYNTAGTSFAAPKVSGAAALLQHKFPGLTKIQIADVILTTADDLGAKGVDPIFGRGRLNVGRALSPIGDIN